MSVPNITIMEVNQAALICPVHKVLVLFSLTGREVVINYMENQKLAKTAIRIKAYEVASIYLFNLTSGQSALTLFSDWSKVD